MSATFLGWDRPALTEVATRLLDRVPAGGPADLRALTILLPGGRAGRTLVELLAEKAARAGRGVLLPRIVTPRGLIEIARPRADVPPSALETRLSWIAAVAETPRERLGDLLPDADRTSSAALVRLALRFDRFARELGEEGRSADDVVRVANRRGSPEERARLQAFAEIAERAALRLARGGRRAPFAHAPTGAAHDPGAVIAVGLADPRARVRAVLESLNELEVWIHAPESIAESFDPLGSLLPECGPALSSELRFREGSWRIADTPVGQATHAVEAVLAARERGEHPTLCVLDPEVRPLVVDRLRSSGSPVHDAAGRPGGRTAPGRLLPTIRAVLEEGDYESLAALARHPDIDRAIEARVEPGRNGEQILESLDRFHSEALPVTVEAIGGAAAGLRRALQESIAPLAAPPRPAAEWAEPIGRVVDRLLGSSPEDDPAREALHAAVDELAAVPHGIDGPIEATLALRVLESELSTSSVPAGRMANELELVGWLEVELDPAPSLIVVGANERFLPARSGALDPLLPPRLREELGLTNDEHRAARDALVVRSLAAGGRDVTWIAGRRSAEGDPHHPSRFWLTDSGSRAGRVRSFYEPRTPEPSPPSLLPPRGDGPRLEIPRPTPPDEPIRRVSVTALGDYLRCPYTFYLRRVRHLKEVHDREVELDPLRFGTRLHSVLETFGREPSIRDTDDPALVESFLLDALSDAMRRAHGVSPAAVLRIQQEQMAERLRGFADWHIEEVRSGWSIRHVEAEIPTENPNFSAGEVEFTLSGTIDRIDLHQDGLRARIIDYKTGEAGDTPERAHRVGPRDAKRWKSLQLPLYRHLAPVLGVERELDVGFTLLPRDPRGVRFEPAPWSDAEFDDAIETARETLLRIDDGEFWPPRALSPPWDRVFAGMSFGAQERMLTIGEIEAAEEHATRGEGA